MKWEDITNYQHPEDLNPRVWSATVGKYKVRVHRSAKFRPGEQSKWFLTYLEAGVIVMPLREETHEKAKLEALKIMYSQFSIAAEQVKFCILKMENPDLELTLRNPIISKQKG